MTFSRDKADVSGSVVALDSASLAALESITVQNPGGASAVNIQDGGNSITVDGNTGLIGNTGNRLVVNADGSINVVPQEDSGLEVVDYKVDTAVAAAATANHDKTFATASKLYEVIGSASGLAKFEIQIESGAATGVFATAAVFFNSTANPTVQLNLAKYALVPTGARVRVIRTNKDKQAQDLYTTIVALQG